MLPRALTNKSHKPTTVPSATPSTEPVASTSSQAAVEVAPALSEAQLASLVFDVESALSDYGLYRTPELRERLRISEDGSSIHLSTVALLPQLAKYQITLPVLKTALESSRLSGLTLNAETNVLKRLVKPASGLEQADWPARCYYIENLPPLSNEKTTLHQVRDFLSAALGTSIQTLHFPPPASSGPIQQPPASELSKQTFPKHQPESEAEKLKYVGSKLPAGGGTYKRFVFCVLGDDEAVERAKENWAWMRQPDGEGEVSSDEDDHQGDVDMASSVGASGKQHADKTPKQLAQSHGLRMLPLAEWRRLRQEYQDWSEKLQQLIDAEPATEENFSSIDPTAEKGRSDGDWRAARDEVFAEVQEREEAEFPKGCVVFIKHVNPKATRGVIRSLAQGIVGDAGEVSFVAYDKGMSSAHIRCSTATAASAVQNHFSNEPLVMVDPATDDPSRLVSADDPAAWEVTFDALEAEVLSGRKESMYWADVPLQARFPKEKASKGSQNKNKKRAREKVEVTATEGDAAPRDGVVEAEGQDGAQDPSKHVRFD